MMKEHVPTSHLAGFVVLVVLFLSLVVDIRGYPQETLTLTSPLADWAGILTTQPTYLLMVLGVFWSPRHPVLAAVGAIALLIAGAILLFCGMTLPGENATMPYRFVGLLSLGCGIATAFCLWVRYWMWFSLETSVRAIIGSFIAAGLARLVLSLVHVEVLTWVVLAACIAVVSVPLVLIAKETTPAASSRPRSLLTKDELVQVGTLLLENYRNPIICFILTLFTVSLVVPLDSPSSNFQELVLYSAGALVGCIALFLIWRRSKVLFISPDFSAKYAVLLIAMMVVMPFSGGEYLLLTVFVCGAISALAFIILLVTCIEVAKENEAFSFSVTSLVFFAFGFFLTFGTFVTILARDPMNQQPTASIIALIGIAFVAVVALVAAVKWGVVRSDDAEDAKPARLISYSPEELRANPILTERYKLSMREMDVLILIMSAYSTSKIAEALFISDNTVKSHTKNLYGKLGVHSKQELLDLMSLIYAEAR